MSLPRFLLRLALGARKPVVSGEHRLAGLRAHVTIRRDKHGVPTIEAENDADAFFGLGFAQGQDRAFQLEMLLRVVRGSLAELVGKDALPVDRIARRIGFRRAADAQLAVVDADIRAALEAFVAGVNASQGFGGAKLPHECQLLKAPLTPWEPADVLGLVKLQTFLLPSNWDVELARLQILRADGPEALLALDPAAIGDVAPSNGAAILASDLERFASFVGRGGGSNNWVVAGNRSASGKPLLASDPHLAPNVPAPWYLAHVDTPGWSVTGAALAGAPVFPIGHNGFACWGVTAGLTDNTDLVIESPNDSFPRIRETIRVADGPDEELSVIVTPRGPVVWESAREWIAMRAVWLEPLPLRGFFDSPTARSFEAFRRPFAAWPALPMNLVYADEAGTIAHQLVGQVPRRTGGNGAIPLPAGSCEWNGLVPFHEMPFTLDPAEGFLATANDPPPADGRFGHDYVDAYRARIIRDELAKRTDWTALRFAELQRSVRSMPWEEIRETVLATMDDGDADVRLGLDLLREWDGRIAADSPAATVFELLVSKLAVRVAQAKAPTAWKSVLGVGDDEPFSGSLFSERRVAHLVRLLQTRPEGWFAKSWTELVGECLAESVRELRATRGPGAAFWQWGDLRQLRLEHPLFKDHWLGRAFNVGPVPAGGDSNTILQCAAKPHDPFAFTHNIPNLRAAFDVGNWSNSRFVLAGGQSGNPCSPHYADLFEMWQTGESIPIAWTPDEAIRSAVASLRLSPV
jgi:penicillin G amidase